MTTQTVFSTVSSNQNAQGVAPVPADTWVNTGTPVTKFSYTLTVTPSTGWATAAVKGSPDGLNVTVASAVRVEPNSGGAQTDTQRTGATIGFLSGELIDIGPPGASATLSVTY